MPTTDKKRRQYVQAFKASGLTQATFCLQNNLNPKTFYAWRKRFAKDLLNDNNLTPLKLAPLKTSNFKTATFLPINIVDDQKPLPLQKQHVTQLSFKTKNFCLEFPLNAQENFTELGLILKSLHELC